MTVERLAHWDGDCILGGEPDWFKKAASQGVIARSADGVGSVLLVTTAAGMQCALPGDVLHLADDGMPVVLAQGGTLRSMGAAISHG